VSLTSGGGERNQGTESASRVVAPAISGDGRTVAFATTASNMVPGDTNGLQDVFAVDVASGAVQRASLAANGTQGNADMPSTQGERPSLSYDGTWVAFSSSASNLGAAAGNVLARNLSTGQLVALSRQTGSSVGAPALSRNAAYVVFGAGSALDPRFAGSGLFVRFTSADLAWWWLP
jgi:Tol biopolymer transport system component